MFIKLRHTNLTTRTRTHAHECTRMRKHTHARTHKTHTCVSKHTRARTGAHTPSHMYAHARTHAHTHSRAHARTHARASCTRVLATGLLSKASYVNNVIHSRPLLVSRSDEDILWLIAHHPMTRNPERNLIVLDADLISNGIENDFCLLVV